MRALFIWLAAEAPAGAADFYAIFPHNFMVSLFAPVFLFGVLALAVGVRRFWRDIGPATTGAPAAVAQSTMPVASKGTPLPTGPPSGISAMAGAAPSMR